MYLTAFSYIADCYTLYASSALAAMNVLRNLLAAAFPLVGQQMYDTLGNHGAGSLVAGIATVIAVIPFVGYAYGGKLRAKSRFGREMRALAAARESSQAENEKTQLQQ